MNISRQTLADGYYHSIIVVLLFTRCSSGFTEEHRRAVKKGTNKEYTPYHPEKQKDHKKDVFTLL